MWTAETKYNREVLDGNYDGICAKDLVFNKTISITRQIDVSQAEPDDFSLKYLHGDHLPLNVWRDWPHEDFEQGEALMDMGAWTSWALQGNLMVEQYSNSPPARSSARLSPQTRLEWPAIGALIYHEQMNEFSAEGTSPEERRELVTIKYLRDWFEWVRADPYQYGQSMFVPLVTDEKPLWSSDKEGVMRPHSKEWAWNCPDGELNSTTFSFSKFDYKPGDPREVWAEGEGLPDERRWRFSTQRERFRDSDRTASLEDEWLSGYTKATSNGPDFETCDRSWFSNSIYTLWFDKAKPIKVMGSFEWYRSLAQLWPRAPPSHASIGTAPREKIPAFPFIGEVSHDIDHHNRGIDYSVSCQVECHYLSRYTDEIDLQTCIEDGLKASQFDREPSVFSTTELSMNRFLPSEFKRVLYNYVFEDTSEASPDIFASRDGWHKVSAAVLEKLESAQKSGNAIELTRVWNRFNFWSAFRGALDGSVGRVVRPCFHELLDVSHPYEWEHVIVEPWHVETGPWSEKEKQDWRSHGAVNPLDFGGMFPNLFANFQTGDIKSEVEKVFGSCPIPPEADSSKSGSLEKKWLSDIFRPAWNQTDDGHQPSLLNHIQECPYRESHKSYEANRGRLEFAKKLYWSKGNNRIGQCHLVDPVTGEALQGRGDKSLVQWVFSGLQVMKNLFPQTDLMKVFIGIILGVFALICALFVMRMRQYKNRRKWRKQACEDAVAAEIVLSSTPHRRSCKDTLSEHIEKQSAVTLSPIVVALLDRAGSTTTPMRVGLRPDLKSPLATGLADEICADDYEWQKQLENSWRKAHRYKKKLGNIDKC